MADAALEGDDTCRFMMFGFKVTASPPGPRGPRLEPAGRAGGRARILLGSRDPLGYAQLRPRAPEPPPSAP